MIRTILSFLVVASLLVGQSPAIAQTKPGPPSTVKPAVTTTVNINAANAAEFDRLPGVGAKTAALIVEYRQKNGPFKKIEELMNVRGVGEKSFLRLKNQLTVGPVRADRQSQF